MNEMNMFKMLNCSKSVLVDKTPSDLQNVTQVIANLLFLTQD